MHHEMKFIESGKVRRKIVPSAALYAAVYV
jgi:hypothetical protein